jgi:hypothetical protein
LSGVAILYKLLQTFTMTEPRHCLYCNSDIKGRADKKFCHDQCRNNFNNQVKFIDNNSYVRIVNNALKKNRKILEQLMKTNGEVTKVPLTKLNALGFKFKYLTHIYTTQKGKVYNYVYEYGYLPLENNWFLIVKDEKKITQSKSPQTA